MTSADAAASSRDKFDLKYLQSGLARFVNIVSLKNKGRHIVPAFAGGCDPVTKRAAGDDLMSSGLVSPAKGGGGD